MGVELSAPGAPRLAASLGDAANQVAELDATNAAAADEVLGHVRPPIRTGALARSVHAEPDPLGFTIAAGGPQAPYAPIVHARNPFISRAMREGAAAVREEYAAALADALDHIQGD